MNERNLNYNHLVTKIDKETVSFVRCYIHYGLQWSSAKENSEYYWNNVFRALSYITKNSVKPIDASLSVPPLVKFLSSSNQVLITTAVALSLAFPWKEFPAPKNTSWEEIHKKLVKYGTLFENMDYTPRNDQLKWWVNLPPNQSPGSNRFFID